MSWSCERADDLTFLAGLTLSRWLFRLRTRAGKQSLTMSPNAPRGFCDKTGLVVVGTCELGIWGSRVALLIARVGKVNGISMLPPVIGWPRSFLPTRRLLHQPRTWRRYYIRNRACTVRFAPHALPAYSLIRDEQTTRDFTVVESVNLLQGIDFVM